MGLRPALRLNEELDHSLIVAARARAKPPWLRSQMLAPGPSELAKKGRQMPVQARE